LDPILPGIALALVLFVFAARFIIKRSGRGSLPDEARPVAEASPPDEVAAGSPEGDGEPPGTLHDGLTKTRADGFIARIGRLFSAEAAGTDVLDDLEEVLLTADIGVQTAQRLFATVRETLSRSELQDADRVCEVLRAEVTAILATTNQEDERLAGPDDLSGPHVVMVLGVNGSGKTTSIGKLAARAIEQGHTTCLVAGDTFRAAAAEQLEQWGQRVGAEVTRGEEGADPSSVVFDGLRAGLAQGVDIILVDTAGRLHTQRNLMEELKKVRRVMGKAIPGAPHEVLLVVDATTGQNAIQQAATFQEATDVTGIVLTKLDGTAKGGVVIGVCDTLGIPIRYVGVGERVADLRPFEPRAFVEALFAA